MPREFLRLSFERFFASYAPHHHRKIVRPYCENEENVTEIIMLILFLYERLF